MGVVGPVVGVVGPCCGCGGAELWVWWGQVVGVA